MIVLYSLGGIMAIIILLALIAPKHYQVQRHIVINKPLTEVFNY